MTTDAAVIRILAELDAGLPYRAPAGLLERTLADVAVDAGRRRPGWRPPMRLGLGLTAAAAVVVAASIVGGLGLIVPGQPTPVPTAGPSASPNATPSPSATRTPGPSPTPEDAAARVARAIDIESPDAAVDPPGYAIAGRLLTSSTFGLPVTFWLDSFGPAEPTMLPDEVVGSDWCPATAGDRWIEVGYLMACVWNVRILRPAIVGCPSPISTPTVEAFAAALLANPTLGAVDLGPIDRNTTAGGLFLRVPEGRLITIPVEPGRAFEPVEDPDGCHVASGSDVVEVRHDVPQTLYLIDVAGELVVVRLAPAQDLASLEDAAARGYLDGGDWLPVLRTMHELAFE